MRPLFTRLRFCLGTAVLVFHDELDLKKNRTYTRVGLIRNFRNKNFSCKTFHEEQFVIRSLREWNLKQQEYSVIMTLKNENV